MRARAHSDTSLADTTRAIMGGSWSHGCLLSLIGNRYTYSLVFAADMYSAVFKSDPLDPAYGDRYRRSILRPGGSRDELDSLKVKEVNSLVIGYWELTNCRNSLDGTQIRMHLWRKYLESRKLRKIAGLSVVDNAVVRKKDPVDFLHCTVMWEVSLAL